MFHKVSHIRTHIYAHTHEKEYEKLGFIVTLGVNFCVIGV